MTPTELAQLLKDNPDIAVIPERGSAPTPAQLAMRQAAVQAAQAEPSEEQMQAAVIAWADAQTHPALKWLFHVPNGGHRDPATAGRMKAAGVRRGVPDLLLPWSTGMDVGLAIEMKRKPNKPTPEQLAWLEYLFNEGWATHICYSAEEAIAVLEAYVS